MKNVEPSTGMISTSSCSWKKLAATGPSAAERAVRPKPIATVKANAVSARSSSSSSGETTSAWLTPRSLIWVISPMKITATATTPKSDGFSRCARIAIDASTSRRPPTYEPYAHSIPRKVRAPTPCAAVTLPTSASRGPAMTRAPPRSPPPQQEAAPLLLGALGPRRQLDALHDGERRRVHHPVDLACGLGQRAARGLEAGLEVRGAPLGRMGIGGEHVRPALLEYPDRERLVARAAASLERARGELEQRGALLDERAQALRMLLKGRFQLGVGGGDAEAARVDPAQQLLEDRRERTVRRLDQQVARVAAERRQLELVVRERDGRRQRHLAARHDEQVDAVVADDPVHARGVLLDPVELHARVVVAHVRRGHERARARGRRRVGQRDAAHHVVRAVVDARQHVRVQVDHRDEP